MKKWQQVLLQIAINGANILQLWSPLIPERPKLLIGLGLGTCSVLAGMKQANYNPDGTEATKPYVK